MSLIFDICTCVLQYQKSGKLDDGNNEPKWKEWKDVLDKDPFFQGNLW